jgi:hypothetical protein
LHNGEPAATKPSDFGVRARACSGDAERDEYFHRTIASEERPGVATNPEEFDADEEFAEDDDETTADEELALVDDLELEEFDDADDADDDEVVVVPDVEEVLEVEVEDDVEEDIDVVDDDDDEGDLDEETDDVVVEDEDEESLDVLLAREKSTEDDDLGRLEEPRDGLTVPAQPISADEFTCRSCFLVKNRAQLADEELLICFDCA